MSNEVIAQHLAMLQTEAARLIHLSGLDAATTEPFQQALAALIAVLPPTISLPEPLPTDLPKLLTQLQDAHAHAEAERDRLYRLFMHAPAAISVVRGPTFIYELANLPYRQLLGSQRPLDGLPLLVAVPDLPPDILAILDHVYATGERFVGQERPITLDWDWRGTPITKYMTFIYEPLRTATGVIDGIMSFAYDVTPQVEARQQLIASEQHLQQAVAEAKAARATAEGAVQLRDDFLSLAAHELKTPLTALLGYAQVLERQAARTQDADPQTTRASAQITAQALRLNMLISTLLDIARINHGHLTLDPQPLDLGAWVVRVAGEMQSITNRHPLLVSVPAVVPLILAESVRLEQVIYNLVQNAVKYSPLNSPITLSITTTDAEVGIAVTDRGKGIPAAAMPHLFERFYRVAQPGTAHIAGLGIGLFVVKEIIDLHGGHITVETTEGQGSTFTVWLPRLDAA